MLDLGLRKSHLFLGRQAGAAELAGSLEKKCIMHWMRRTHFENDTKLQLKEIKDYPVEKQH